MNQRREGRPRRRPPWWPEGEPWPPSGRHGFRPPPRFLWRLAIFFFVAVAGLAALGALGIFAAMTAVGAVPAPHELRIVAGAALVVVVLLAVRWFGRLGRPLTQLVTSARRIEAGDFSARVPEFGPPDLRSVARAFNAMAARLAADQARRRDFLADVAHEMRTPLSVIQGQAEAIVDGVHPGDAAHLAPILDATRLLERLVDDLRTLAQVESGALQIVHEPVDVARLVEETVAGFGAQASSAGVELRTELGEGAGSLTGDPARLQGVLGNLVANAIRHTPAGGSVKVAARRSGDRMTLEVTDDGEGIAPDLLPRVFDRFVRGPRSDGTGLGLAIARDVVAAHGGTISVRSVQGSGASFTVSLPVQGG